MERSKRKLRLQPLKHQLPLLLKINNHTKETKITQEICQCSRARTHTHTHKHQTLCLTMWHGGVHVNVKFMNFDDEPKHRAKESTQPKWKKQEETNIVRKLQRTGNT